MTNEQERMTLRKLIEMVGPEFMDAELSVHVRDGHRNTAWVPFPTSLSWMPRQVAHATTGEPACLAISVSLQGQRLVKARA